MQKSFRKPCPTSRIAYPPNDLELDTWVDQSIQTEIVRGRTLQEQKSLSSDRSNAVYINPVPAKSRINQRKSNNPKWNCKRLRSVSPIARSGRMSPSTSRDDSDSYRKLRKSLPCSMRINELAVPTKRQCMASWRANSHILPEVMVNRLKMRVMDQEPIVKVSDAVHCLKHERRSVDSRFSNPSTSSKNSRNRNKINNDAMNSRIQEQNQVLGDVFGRRIAQLLLLPMNITLNSRLQKLSTIISKELQNILKSKKMPKTDKATNRRMVQEVSDKVAIWIGAILEDSSEKLLEEELKVAKWRRILFCIGQSVKRIQRSKNQKKDLEEQEGPVLDILEELTNNILNKCAKTPSISEKSEFLSINLEDKDKVEPDNNVGNAAALPDNEIIVDDANFENVEPTETNQIIQSNDDTVENYIDEELGVDSLKAEDFLDKHDEPDVNVIYRKDAELVTPENENEDQQNKTANTDEDEAADYVIYRKNSELVTPENESEDQQNKTADTNEDEAADYVIYRKDAELETPENENEDQQNKTANIDKDEAADYIIFSDEKDSKNDSLIEDDLMPSSLQNHNEGKEGSEDNEDHEVPEDTFSFAYDTNNDIDNNIENVTDTNDELTSNVSDTIEILSEDAEEKNKKVKFSYENLGRLNETEDLFSLNRDNFHTAKDNEHLLEFATDVHRPINIDFAPPNENLLSDADESWPGTPPVTKPSASVTRSISSMGRILESDEKISNAFEDGTEYLNLNYSPERNDAEKINESIKYERQEMDKQPHYYGNKADEIVPSDPEESGSKHLIEIVQSSFTEHDTLPPLLESELENTNLIYAELNLDGPDRSIKKDEPDVIIENENLNHSQNTVQLKVINPVEPGTFHAIYSKSKKHDSNENYPLGKLDGENKCFEMKHDRSKSAERTEKGSVTGECNQRRSMNRIIYSKKFDYRVHQNTAPAWIRRGQGDPSENPCPCRPFHYSDTSRLQKRELEMQKWCQDLDFVLINLDKWKNWLNYISKYITTLKHKAGVIVRDKNVSEVTNIGKNSGIGQNKPTGTDKDYTWRELNKRATGNLELRRQDDTVKLKISSSAAKYCVTCGRTKQSSTKKRHHRSHTRNVTEALCRRHNPRPTDR